MRLSEITKLHIQRQTNGYEISRLRNWFDFVWAYWKRIEWIYSADVCQVLLFILTAEGRCCCKNAFAHELINTTTAGKKHKNILWTQLVFERLIQFKKAKRKNNYRKIFCKQNKFRMKKRKKNCCSDAIDLKKRFTIWWDIGSAAGKEYENKKHVTSLISFVIVTIYLIALPLQRCMAMRPPSALSFHSAFAQNIDFS